MIDTNNIIISFYNITNNIIISFYNSIIYTNNITASYYHKKKKKNDTNNNTDNVQTFGVQGCGVISSYD